MRKSTFLLLATLLFCAAANGQCTVMHEKIDPFLLPAVEESLRQDSLAAKARSARQKKAKSSPAGKTEKSFECIVYTKNGQALRDSGFTVNSILPEFATVVATARQIIRIAEFPFVRYIEAARKNEPENKQQ